MGERAGTAQYLLTTSNLWDMKKKNYNDEVKFVATVLRENAF